MKKIALFFSILFFCLSTTAQDNIPDFGKIDKIELEIKDCEFDPGADAVVLLDEGKIQFAYVEEVGLRSETGYRIRIKILKESAIARSEVKIRYYSKSKYGDVTDIRGISYNLDEAGNIVETKMGKEAIFRKDINAEYSEVSFALPNVKIGTVFEYKYMISRRAFGYIPPWNFQQTIPVRYSAYRVIVPQYFQFIVQTIKRQQLEQKDTKSTGTWYIMRNVPGLKEEPFGSGKKDYLQRIEFQLSKIDAPGYSYERNTWPKIIAQLLEADYFGGVLKKHISADDELDAALSNAQSIREKTRIVYNYVQSNMEWNKEYDIAPDNTFTLKDAWKNKNGRTADINFILIRLLKNAGVDAKPLLVSTKENGTINSLYPFVNQFNSVLAYVKDGNERFIMNAADKYNPFNQVPEDVLYTNGLLIDKTEGGLIGLNNDKKYAVNCYFTAGLEPGGKMSGNATINSSGYARNDWMNAYRNNKLKELLQKNNGIEIKVDSMAVNNVKNELLPLEQQLQISANIQSSGDYYFLPYNILTGFEKNSFIEEQRVMGIDFIYPKSYIVAGSYILADTYSVSELPKNIRIMMPDSSIMLTRTMQQDGNIISFRLTLDFKVSRYPAENYPYVKEFFKKMYNIIDERIVLKKN